MGVPRWVLVRLRAGGGWSRGQLRWAWAGRLWGCRVLSYGGCGPVGAGRAVPRAPGELQSPAPQRTDAHSPHHDGPSTTSRTTTDRSPHRAPRTVGRTARHGGPQAAYGAQGTGW